MEEERKGEGKERRTDINPRLHRRPTQQSRRSEDENEDDSFVFAGIALCVFHQSFSDISHPLMFAPTPKLSSGNEGGKCEEGKGEGDEKIG